MLSTVELLPKVLLWTTCFPNSVSAAASASAASAVCIYYVFIGGALRAPLYVHDKIHTAEAAAEAAAEAGAAAAAVAAAAPAPARATGTDRGGH